MFGIEHTRHRVYDHPGVRNIWYKRNAEGAEERARPDISIVIPLLDEAANLGRLYTQLSEVMSELERPYEIILVDDGSRDNSFSILRRLHEIDDHLSIVRLRRNFGQTAALSAGFEAARGRIIVTMDGDLQNDPADVPMLLEKLEEGYDVVSGWRVNRQEPFITRRLPSMVANYLISLLTGVTLHDSGCSLKAYRREVVEHLRLYGEMHRFIPALASWMGIRVAEVKVKHAPRRYGRSKYGLGRTVRVILDLLTVKFLLDYAVRPMQIFGMLGILSLAIGTGLGLYLSSLKLFFSQPLGDRPLLLLAVLLVIFGGQLLVMGLLGELVIRTYFETAGRRTYVIRDRLPPGFGSDWDGVDLDAETAKPIHARPAKQSELQQRT